MAIVIKAILIMDNIGIGRLLIRIQLKHPDCFKPAVRRLLHTAVYSYNEGRDGGVGTAWARLPQILY